MTTATREAFTEQIEKNAQVLHIDDIYTKHYYSGKDINTGDTLLVGLLRIVNVNEDNIETIGTKLIVLHEEELDLIYTIVESNDNKAATNYPLIELKADDNIDEVAYL